jgi:inhibitor of KinA
VPAGTVAIAGKQTGIYPFDSPGGWWGIGWTPLKLFDQGKSLLAPGDEVKFIPQWG